MRRGHDPFRRRPPVARGYTLIEALLMVVILGIVGAGIGSSLIGTQWNTRDNDKTLLIDNTLVAQMETLRATWQSQSLGVQTSQITVGGTAYTMTVDIEKADPNGGGAQSTFFSLTIQIAGQSLCTYVSN